MESMLVQDFIPADIEVKTDQGSASWRAPSNIALVKYWGKYEGQIPANPSLSFTLSASHTHTTTHFKKRTEQGEIPTFDLIFEGKSRPDFHPKISTYFERILPYTPWLKDFHLEISTENSFPHSSGIASSASSMAALSLCVLEMERVLYPSMTDDAFLRKASFLARLGSGSACRSVEGPLVSWGRHEKLSGGSDLYGTAYGGSVHDVFREYRDTILLVHKGQKTVSSTAGHSLMKDHHYARQRFSQAHLNLTHLIDILKNGDLEGFAQIVESEALSLHAMMMTSIPYYLLMKPNTLAIIEKIWEFRRDTGEPLCFTLDAGANVHLLYPASGEDKVLQFIKNELVAYCEKGQYICDQSGQGAKKLESAV